MAAIPARPRSFPLRDKGARWCRPFPFDEGGGASTAGTPEGERGGGGPPRRPPEARECPGDRPTERGEEHPGEEHESPAPIPPGQILLEPEEDAGQEPVGEDAGHDAVPEVDPPLPRF